MTLLSSQLAVMKTTAESTFNDTCSIHAITITGVALGENTTTEVTTNNIPCGFTETNTYKNWRGEIVTYNADAILRLSLTRSIDTSDEITVRGNRYKVQGINIGRTIKIIPLNRIESSNE